MDCVFLHRKSTHFKFTYVLFHNQTLDLNGDSFSWLRMLKLKRAKREGGGGREGDCSVQPEHKRLSAEGQFAKEGPGGKCLCLCWLRTQLQFNRLDLFQTSQPTNRADTQGDGKRREKMIRAGRVKFCLLFEWLITLHTFWIFGLNVEFWHEAAKYNVITWQSGSGSIPVSHLVHLQAQFTPGFNALLGWSDHQESSSWYASRTWSEMVRATCGSVHPRHVLKEHFNQEGTFSHYLVPCGSNLAFMVY